MWYTNAWVFTEGGSFEYGSFCVDHGRFVEITNYRHEGGVDLGGAYVIPGLVDIHIHGAMGKDFSDGDVDGLRIMARYLARSGITSFAPTSMTLPYEVLENAFSAGRCFRIERFRDCARLVGIHMEGPFLSESKKGAQNKDYLKEPDSAAVLTFLDHSDGLIRIVDVAPELPGAGKFIETMSQKCTVSLAHTEATYEEASNAFCAGAKHVTHLFNGMCPLHHREPGIIGAAAERERITAELICDGVHVHPSAIRMAFRMFPERICLISDSLRCCGMDDGDYMLGGQIFHMRNGCARLSDGTLAGASTNLFECMRRAISFGIPKEAAIRAATLIPAKVIGCDAEVGSIALGKSADFVVCTEGLQKKAVFIDGWQIS